MPALVIKYAYGHDVMLTMYVTPVGGVGWPRVLWRIMTRRPFVSYRPHPHAEEKAVRLDWYQRSELHLEATAQEVQIYYYAASWGRVRPTEMVATDGLELVWRAPVLPWNSGSIRSGRSDRSRSSVSVVAGASSRAALIRSGVVFLGLTLVAGVLLLATAPLVSFAVTACGVFGFALTAVASARGSRQRDPK